MFRRLLVLLFLLASCAASAQRILTTPDFTTFSSRDGVDQPYFASMLPLPEGGLILAGRFEVWYEGIRFRDLMRLRPNGEPDTSWRVDITYTNPFAGAYGAALTPTGVFIRGNRVLKINGVATGTWPFVSLMDGHLINPLRLPAQNYGGPYGIVYDVSNYDSATGYVYTALSAEPWILRRISGVTGELDLEWGYRASTGFWIGAADSLGGLWNSRCESSFMLTDCWLERIPLGSSTSTLVRPDFIRPQLSFVMPNHAGAAEFRVLSNGLHAYASQRRFGTNGAQDPAWLTVSQPWYIGATYAFFPTAPTTFSYPSSPNPTTLKRALLIGSGEPEAWAFALPTNYSMYTEYGFGFNVLPWPTLGDSNNIAIAMFKTAPPSLDGPAGPTSPPVFIVKDDLLPEEALNVVEYYVPALKHYFMTGRKSEQATLDALPASFTRTGMSFAAKSSRYRDIPEQPVCRLYAAPEKGGSNSHFYGIGDDCPTLNKLTGLKYEGYDFSVSKPAASGCPATAPNAVTRLFNNKAAANDGNHRYVVSTTTKAKMIAQGWVDEGAVFCSSGVTDAVVN
jgi:hypothetical protein